MEITLPKSGTVIELDDDMYGDYTDEQIYQLVYDGIKDEDDLKEDAEFIASYLPKESPEDLYVGQTIGGTTGSLAGAGAGALAGSPFGPAGIAVGALLGGLGGGALGGGLGEYAEQEITGKEGNVLGAAAEEGLLGAIPGGAGVPLRGAAKLGRVAGSIFPRALESQASRYISNALKRFEGTATRAQLNKAMRIADTKLVDVFAESGKGKVYMEAAKNQGIKVPTDKSFTSALDFFHELKVPDKVIQEVLDKAVERELNKLAGKTAVKRSATATGITTGGRGLLHESEQTPIDRDTTLFNPGLL